MSKCFSCQQPFDSKKRYPMEIQPCAHYICLSCFGRVDKCPKCAKPIEKATKSYKKMQLVAMESSQLIDLRHVPRKTKQVVVECQNHDPTSWSEVKQICVRCEKKLPGWRCQKCKFFICDICSGTVYSWEACPNGHPMEWGGRLKDLTKCQRCQKIQVSLPCPKCSIRHCMSCRTESKQKCSTHNVFVVATTDKYCKQCLCYNKQCTQCIDCGNGPRCSRHRQSISTINASCPNEAAYQQKQQCSRPYCNNSAFWKCKTCPFKLCNYCGCSEFQQERCPNGHRNKWSGQRTNACSHCQKKEPGWACHRCQYNMCNNCLKYNPIKYFPGAYQQNARCSLI